MFNNFNLYLVRHGQSAVNVQPDLMGQTAEVPLTFHGQTQATFLGHWFKKSFREQKIKFDLAYSSTHLRALNTAELVLKEMEYDAPIILADDLREYSAGDWTGASRLATITSEVRSHMTILEHSFVPPNGESIHMVQRRSAKWLEDNILYNKNVMEMAQKKEEPLNIICFSHGITIKSLIHYIMGFDRSFTWKIQIDNTSITKFHFGDHGWSLKYLNVLPLQDSVYSDYQW